jgi:hypothetical protein
MKLGKAFSDSVISVHKPLMRPSRMMGSRGGSVWADAHVCDSPLRRFFHTFMAADLAVVQGHHFRTLADGNRTRELIRHAPRGILVGPDGQTSRCQYSVLSIAEAM